MKFEFRLFYWPILTLAWMILTFIVSYIVAVVDEHVNAAFPFISDTGNFPPESCIFGQMLNIGACLEFITMFIRHKVVNILQFRAEEKKYKRWNKWSCFFGICSCLGISMVANFQETSAAFVHFSGAFLTFVCGGFYCLIQTYLTWICNVDKKLKIARFILSAMVFPLFLSMLICSFISRKNFKGDKLKWKSEQTGYDLHLVATIAEWFMAIAINLFVLTFCSEFKQVEFKGITFLLNR